MAEEPPTKRHKPNFKEQNKSKMYKKSNKKFLEVGQRGFLITCNFREKESVREAYNILNQYADELYGPNVEKTETIAENAEAVPTDADSTVVKPDSDSEDEDISTLLDKDIKATAKTNKLKAHRFQQVDTGTQNLIFIKTTIKDPIELTTHMLRDIANTKITRFILRFIPIESVCKANILDITNAAGALFDKHYLNAAPTTFSIIYNKRYNNRINRDEIIRKLADMIISKNINHKVNLSQPETSVIVEVIKGLCCVSVVPLYLEFKRYNLHELTTQDKKEKPEKMKTVTKREVEEGSDAKEETKCPEAKAEQKAKEEANVVEAKKEEPEAVAEAKPTVEVEQTI